MDEEFLIDDENSTKEEIFFEPEKKCAKCGGIKKISFFNKDRYKKDKRRSYCKECETIQFKEKKQKKKEGNKKETIPSKPDEKKVLEGIEKAENSKKELEKTNNIVEFLSTKISQQYFDDLQKSDQTYDLFYKRIADGSDNTEASKAALTKALELRIAATKNLNNLLNAAVKLEEIKNKKNPNNENEDEFNAKKLKNSFSLSDENGD